SNNMSTSTSPERAEDSADWSTGLAELCRDSLPDRGPLGHALMVIAHFRKPSNIDAITVQPLRQGEEIGIADRVGGAHHPRTHKHLAFDQGEALADRLRHLALHLLDGGGIVDPAMAAHPVGVGH